LSLDLQVPKNVEDLSKTLKLKAKRTKLFKENEQNLFVSEHAYSQR